MRQQHPEIPNRIPVEVARWCGRAAAGMLLFSALAFARLTPEDLAAISETGLIPLTGEQEGEYPAKDYVVVETMKVRRGQTVSFAAGARLYFHSAAKITVSGMLKCEGTPAKPVIIGRLPFKLPKLSSHQMVFLDSSAIAVYRSGTLSLSHTRLADSTVCISLTDETSGFSFDSILTSGNWLTLPDTATFFPKGAIVTCEKLSQALYVPCRPVLPVNLDTRKERKPLVITPKLPIRIVLGSIAVGGAGAWYYFNREAQRAGEQFHAEDDRLKEEVAKNGGKPPNTDALIRYRKNNNANFLYSTIAAVAGGCALTGFTVTFLIGGHGK
jgi:hypothetical protein